MADIYAENHHLDHPMTPIERVRCDVAMAETGSKFEPMLEDVMELLQAHDALRDHAPAVMEPVGDDNEENDLVWRLQHPAWSHGPTGPAKLDAETCVTDMRLAATEIKRLSALQQSAASTVEPVAVLNGIRDALEERGFFHMANGRDIGALLDERAAPITSPEPMMLEGQQWLDAWAERRDTSPEPDAVRVDERLVEYMRSLPIGHLTIGGELTPVVQPQYLLASDRDAILAALSRPAHGGWKDISTAPNDEPVLVSAWLNNEEGVERFACMARRVFDTWVDEDDGDPIWTPTHWMRVTHPRHDRVTSQPDTDGGANG